MSPLMPYIFFNLVSCQKKMVPQLNSNVRHIKLEQKSARCLALYTMRCGRFDFGNIAKNPCFSFAMLPSCALIVHCTSKPVYFTAVQRSPPPCGHWGALQALEWRLVRRLRLLQEKSHFIFLSKLGRTDEWEKKELYVVPPTPYLLFSLL